MFVDLTVSPAEGISATLISDHSICEIATSECPRRRANLSSASSGGSPGGSHLAMRVDVHSSAHTVVSPSASLSITSYRCFARGHARELHAEEERHGQPDALEECQWGATGGPLSALHAMSPLGSVHIGQLNLQPTLFGMCPPRGPRWRALNEKASFICAPFSSCRYCKCSCRDVSVATNHHRRAFPGGRADGYAWPYSRRTNEEGT